MYIFYLRKIENFKRNRTAQRSDFTKAFNDFKESASAERVNVKQVKILFEMLDEKMSDLSATSNEIVDLMLDSKHNTDEAILQEYNDADEYKSKFFMTEIKITDLTTP